MAATPAADVLVQTKKKSASAPRFQRRFPVRKHPPAGAVGVSQLEVQRGSSQCNSDTKFRFAIPSFYAYMLDEHETSTVVPHRFRQLPRHSSPLTAAWIKDFHSSVYRRSIARWLTSECEHDLFRCSCCHISHLFCHCPAYASLLGESRPQIRWQTASGYGSHSMAHARCSEGS